MGTCITKVFNEWQLVGVALYNGFLNINIRGNSCSQTFMGVKGVLCIIWEGGGATSGYACIHTSLTNSAGSWRQNPIMTLQDKLWEAAPRSNTRSVSRTRYYVPSVPVWLTAVRNQRLQSSSDVLYCSTVPAESRTAGTDFVTSSLRLS